MNLLISGSTGNIGRIILAKFKEKHFNVIPINLRFASTLSSNLGLSNGEDSFFFHLASQNSNMSAENIRKETDLIKSAIDIAKINAVQNFVFLALQNYILLQITLMILMKILKYSRMILILKLKRL